VVEPDPSEAAAYAELNPLYEKLYFAFGKGDELKTLRRVAAARNQGA
jgi:hypothetical protein